MRQNLVESRAPSEHNLATSLAEYTTLTDLFSKGKTFSYYPPSPFLSVCRWGFSESGRVPKNLCVRYNIISMLPGPSPSPFVKA